MSCRVIVCVGLDPLTIHALQEYFPPDIELRIYDSAERFTAGAQQKKMTLIFLNARLPDADNLPDLCLALRSLPATETVPIIILSDQIPDAKEKIRLYQTNLIDGYFTTPLNLEELAAYANVFLQRQILQEELEEKNRLLAQMSVTDDLMGIHNRRFLMQRLHEEIGRMNRYHYPLTVMMLDIDFFKKINDEWGHRHGDIVLKELADSLKESLRAQDVVCRYGGEEIVIICPHTNHQSGMILAQRLRSRVKEHSFSSSIHPLRVTLSIGLVTCDGCRDLTTDRMIHLIDAQLYQAKNAGRDCVRGITLPAADSPGMARHAA